MPIRGMSGVTVMPGVLRSTRKADMPLAAGTDLSVTANTRKVSAKPELVVKIFSPLMTYSSPSFTAVVRPAATSEPAPGSVRPKQPILLPSTSGRSHFSFCSSVANSLMLEAQREVWTDRVMPVLASTLDISSMHST